MNELKNILSEEFMTEKQDMKVKGQTIYSPIPMLATFILPYNVALSGVELTQTESFFIIKLDFTRLLLVSLLPTLFALSATNWIIALFVYLFFTAIFGFMAIGQYFWNRIDLGKKLFTYANSSQKDK